MNDGPYMLVHQVTGTYLEIDEYTDNAGVAVQTWNVDPLETAKGRLGHKWLLHQNPDESFLIKSFENQRCLTASATSASDFPRLQDCDGNPRQHWLFEKVGDDPDPTPSSRSPTRATPWESSPTQSATTRTWFPPARGAGRPSSTTGDSPASPTELIKPISSNSLLRGISH
jgi:hypothetical protein